MALVDLPLDCSLGAAQAGLTTVGYTLYEVDGSVSVSRTETDVEELGIGGDYAVTVPNVPDDATAVVWDSFNGSTITASESLKPYHDRAAILADTSVMQPIVSTNLDARVSEIPTSADFSSLARGAVVAVNVVDPSPLSIDVVPAPPDVVIGVNVVDPSPIAVSVSETDTAIAVDVVSPAVVAVNVVES